MSDAVSGDNGHRDPNTDPSGEKVATRESVRDLTQRQEAVLEALETHFGDAADLRRWKSQVEQACAGDLGPGLHALLFHDQVSDISDDLLLQPGPGNYDGAWVGLEGQPAATWRRELQRILQSSFARSLSRMVFRDPPGDDAPRDRDDRRSDAARDDAGVLEV